MVLITGVVLMLAIALVALFSCTTKQKVITEYVTVHATIRTRHTDTVEFVRVVTLTDTIRQVEWHNITLSQGGDTIKEVHHFYDTQKTIVVDSTNRYKAVVDSLKAALTHEKEQYKEITKTKHIVAWWEWMCIFIIVAVMGVAAFKTNK